MVMSSVRYEAVRQRRLEENMKRMQELHLPLLSQALLLHASSPKPSPMSIKTKTMKLRVSKTERVPVRRSLRFSNNSSPQYQLVTSSEPVRIPRSRATHRHGDFTNMVYASDEARESAIMKAEKLESSLLPRHPTFVRSMLPSHVSGGFWLGLSVSHCKRLLPKGDSVIQLIDEKGDAWPVIYLARKTGLSGGWKKFAIDHNLVDGDALVFELIKPTVFQVYILRVDNSDNASSTEQS